MAQPPGPDTDHLLDAAGRGDAAARGQLLERHRTKLTRMVAVRLDRRLAARVDPSDVVQEALADAAKRLDEYLRDRPIPFYPWLRRLAWDRLADGYRRHVRAAQRTVAREERPPLPGASAVALADRLLAASGDRPGADLSRAERQARVQAALDRLPDRDREVLVLRHLEDLSTAEAAAVLGVSEGAVKVRLLRAVQRLRDLLDREDLP
jgi:RNA polymerase sigma-70 factor (ECF subfamily)